MALHRCCDWLCNRRRGIEAREIQPARGEMSQPLRALPTELDAGEVLVPEKPQLNSLDGVRIAALGSRSRESTAEVVGSPNDFDQAFNSPDSFVSIASTASSQEEIEHRDNIMKANTEPMLRSPPTFESFPNSPVAPQDEPRLRTFESFDHTEEETQAVDLEVAAPRFSDWRSELDSLQSIQRDLMAGLIERLEFEDWEVNSSNKELRIFRRMAPGGAPGCERSIPMFRVERIMTNGLPKAVFEILTDAENQPSWNPFCASGKDHGAEHGATLLQSSFKGLGPVSAREALEFRAISRDANAETLWIAYISAGTTELGVPVTEKHQRSYTMFSGYLLRPGEAPNTTELTFISHIDAGGGLPDWITNKAGPKGATDVTRALQGALDKRRNDGRARTM